MRSGAEQEFAYMYRCNSGVPLSSKGNKFERHSVSFCYFPFLISPVCSTEVMLADCGRHNDPIVRKMRASAIKGPKLGGGGGGR